MRECAAAGGRPPPGSPTRPLPPKRKFRGEKCSPICLNPKFARGLARKIRKRRNFAVKAAKFPTTTKPFRKLLYLFVKIEGLPDRARTEIAPQARLPEPRKDKPAQPCPGSRSNCPDCRIHRAGVSTTS